METKVLNLTPHDITIVFDDGSSLVFPPSGQLARVAVKTVRTGTLIVAGKEIPITHSEFGEAYGLPAPKEDTIYIVSLAVAKSAPERRDLYVPNEGVRDAHGRTVAHQSFAYV